MGGDVDRWTFYYSSELHYDYECIWKIFSIVSLHSDCTDSIIFICRRAESEYRKKFLKSYAAVCLEGAIVVLASHYIFIVCIITASCQSRCSSSHYGVELYWRVDFQYACTGRCGEDVRQGSEGNDGIIKTRVCMVRNRTYPVVCYEPILQCLCCHYISYFPENRNEQNLLNPSLSGTRNLEGHIVFHNFVVLMFLPFASQSKNPVENRKGSQQIEDCKCKFLMSCCPWIQNCGNSKKV